MIGYSARINHEPARGPHWKGTEVHAPQWATQARSASRHPPELVLFRIIDPVSLQALSSPLYCNAPIYINYEALSL
jgi:hypothetical protein